jgi:hypothetical protein
MIVPKIAIKTKNTITIGAMVFFLGLGGEQRVLEHKGI